MGEKEFSDVVIIYILLAFALAFLFLLLFRVSAEPIQLSTIEIEHDEVWIIGEENVIRVIVKNLSGENIEPESVDIILLSDVEHEKEDVVRIKDGVYERTYIILNKTSDFLEFNITVKEQQKIISEARVIELIEEPYLNKKVDELEDKLQLLIGPIRRHPAIAIMVVALFFILLFFIELVVSNRAMEKR